MNLDDEELTALLADELESTLRASLAEVPEIAICLRVSTDREPG